VSVGARAVADLSQIAAEHPNNAVLGRTVGYELVKAWGLEKVIDLDIELHLDGAAEVTVRKFLTAKEAQDLVDVIVRYNLVEVDDAG
jgi:hypothetical protein